MSHIENNKNRKTAAIILIFILIFLAIAPHFIKEPVKELTVLPTFHDASEFIFPLTEIGNITNQQIFAIKNTGQERIRIKEIVLTGNASENFILENVYDKVIRPGQVISFSVFFSPVNPGTHSASILIKTHTKDIPEMIVNITGTAVRTFNYTLLSPSPPQPPVAVIAAFEGNSIRVTWVNQPGGEISESYNIYVSDSSEINISNALKIENASKPYIYNNYTINETVYFAVTSKNNVGEGRLSEIVSIRPGKAYYVSYVKGNDSNNGTTPETPWKTLEKVNSQVFEPGEFILFEKGNIFNGRIDVRQSGAEEKRITYGSYGDGNKPIITTMGPVPLWNDTNAWTYWGNNIWSITHAPWRIPMRLILSGEEVLMAKDIDYIDDTYKWHYIHPEIAHEGGTVYLYSEENPALVNTEIIDPGVLGLPFTFWSSDYVTLSGLNIKGGYRTMDIISSSNLIFEDSFIGNQSAIAMYIVGVWPGLTGPGNRSDNGIIKGCIFDSGFRFNYNYENIQTQDAIGFVNNVSHWRIYGNEIRDWGHTGIGLLQSEEGMKVSNNHIFSNYFTSEGISYGRAWAVGGMQDGAENNHFYRNLVRNTTAPIQIGGSNNYVYYNIIDTVKMTPVRPETTGSGIVLTPGMGQDYRYVSNSNKVFNNLIYNTENIGIDISDWHGDFNINNNEIYNNIVINCGWGAFEKERHAGIGITDRWHVDEPPASKNNIIRNNIIFSEYSDLAIHYRGESLTVGQINNMNGTHGDTIMENYFFNPYSNLPIQGNYLPDVLFIIIDNGFTAMETFDFFGIIIPSGDGVDIGPFELG